MPRAVREKTEMTGIPLGYFVHSQNFPTKESVIDLINLNIEIELKCNPGENVDLIIVNNDSGWQDGNHFLESINGKRLKHGKIQVLHRENFGRSFGGYNHAFKVFGESYDYFIFTEDDVVIGRDGYASIGIENFHKTKNCGFVAYLSLTCNSLDLDSDESLAAHGGVGLTSVSVLKDVVAHHGSLPHADENSSQEMIDIISKGEIQFTNKIHKLGYQLISIPEKVKLYDFAYDIMRGLEVKRFPSLSEKVLHRLKQKTYRQNIVRSIYEQKAIKSLYKLLVK